VNDVSIFGLGQGLKSKLLREERGERGEERREEKRREEKRREERERGDRKTLIIPPYSFHVKRNNRGKKLSTIN